MKKLIVLLLLVCLCGCSSESKLGKLGYSQSDIEKILSFSIDTQDLFCKEYNEKLIELMYVEGFEETRALKYLDYYGSLDNKEMIEAINNNIDIDKLVELYNSEFYVPRLKDIYLKYFNQYDNVRDLIEIVNTNRYVDLYSEIQETDLSKNYLMLINKYHKLPEDYEPQDLVTIDSNYGYGSTRAEVYEQYKKLQDEGNSLGYEFSVCSAYRSYDYQNSLYSRYLENEGGNVAAVDMYSARPGHSEHQSGLCLDLTNPEYGMDDFGLSDAGKWVNENCYKYGFIIRYTLEKENITGYESEPWQIRYVGSSDVAKYIMDTGISFDEYYTCFVE